MFPQQPNRLTRSEFLRAATRRPLPPRGERRNDDAPESQVRFPCRRPVGRGACHRLFLGPVCRGRASGEPSLSQAARDTGDAGDAGTTAKKSAPQTTAIMTSVIPKALAPQYVKGSDGKVHIEYDLLSTNIMRIPVTLTGLEVRAGNGRRLLALQGDALEAATRQIIGATTREVPGSGAVATVVDIEVAPGEVPQRLTNRITYKFQPGTPQSAHTAIGSLRTEGPRLQVPRRPATVIAPPLSGKGWWSGNGCCVPGDAHRFLRLAVDGVRYTKPETFAIDWLGIRDGEFLKGDELENESYFAYGARVRSATGGRVVSVRNNMPDETPDLSGAPLPSVKGPEDYAGNHVVVRMRPGVYALYAHLQPGSVAVRWAMRSSRGSS